MRIGEKKMANEIDQVAKALGVHGADISAAIHSYRAQGRGAQGYDNDEMDANLGLDPKRARKSPRVL
jgi:hypothetical protein